MIFCNYVGFLILIVWLLFDYSLILIWKSIGKRESIFSLTYGGVLIHAFFHERIMQTSELLPDKLIRKLRIVKKINKVLIGLFVATMVSCWIFT